MMSNRAWFVLCILGLCSLLVHCTTPSEEVKKTIESVTLGQAQYALPAQTFSQKGFSVGHIPKKGMLLGDLTGLYLFRNDKLQALELDPIVGLTPWRQQYILAAGPKELMVFDGELQKLNFTEKLGLKQHTIFAIAAQQDDVLWISTSAHLWRLKHDKIEAYTSLKDIRSMWSYVGSDYVVLQNSKGALSLLRKRSDGSIEHASLPKDSPTFTTLFPGVGNTLWGLSEGVIYVQEHKDGQIRWLEYPLQTKEQKTDPITSIHLDPNTGHIWAMGTQQIYLINDKKVLRTQQPSSISQKSHIAVAAGAMWISDSKKLHLLIHQTSQDITYEGQVSLFMKKNCWRCHQQVGPGRPLDTYDLIKNNIQSIIQQIEKGTMPSDQKPLIGGDVKLLKQWMENKFPK